MLHPLTNFQIYCVRCSTGQHEVHVEDGLQVQMVKSQLVINQDSPSVTFLENLYTLMNKM